MESMNDCEIITDINHFITSHKSYTIARFYQKWIFPLCFLLFNVSIWAHHLCCVFMICVTIVTAMNVFLFWQCHSLPSNGPWNPLNIHTFSIHASGHLVWWVNTPSCHKHSVITYSKLADVKITCPPLIRSYSLFRLGSPDSSLSSSVN